ncbi:MAG: T9SS type A sorting domain-containing protein [Flavobacteriales bacterium]|nr:T9SS type A sorting domain-containing protein [Flavobacteriales bacterium]
MSLSCYGQGTFPPAAGQVGTTAIHRDSSAIVGWATGCSIERGFMDLSNTSLGLASFGTPADAVGPSNPAIVSLGDSGIATLVFDGSIYDGPGADFAIFENSFSDSFLELAFVEVSSDGFNFFRFPATSTTPDTLQINAFGSTDATHLHNLAGKYRARYGTPFDLSELSGISGLDVNNVTHVRIIDCVGAINPAYATYDQFSNPINDPFPTPFASSGFDLDAVAILNFNPSTGLTEQSVLVKLYPNPVTEYFWIQADGYEYCEIVDLQGRVLKYSNNKQISLSDLPAGQYIARVFVNSSVSSHLLQKR